MPGLGMVLTVQREKGWCCPECERELDGTEDYESCFPDQPMVTCFCGNRFTTVEEMLIKHIRWLESGGTFDE